MLVGLVSAGTAALAVTRPWVTAAAVQPGIPPIQAGVSGVDLHPLAGALTWVLLAAFGAVLATRGRMRQCVGVVIVVAGAVIVGAAAVPGAADPLLRRGLATQGWAGSATYTATWQLWRYLAVVGGLGCLAAGVAVVRRSRLWPTMSARYDAPASASAEQAASPVRAPTESLSETAMWRALDEGRDPTQEP